MLDAALVLLFCLLMGVGALAACIWVVFTGQLATLDGLLLIFISLLLGGLFMLNFLWSIRTGEARELLNYYARRRTKTDASGESSPS